MGGLDTFMKLLELNLSVPAPSNNSPPEGDVSSQVVQGPSSQVLQGPSTPDSAKLPSTTVVLRTNEVVPVSSPPGVSLLLQQTVPSHPGVSLFLQQTCCTTPGTTSSSHLKFLRGALSRHFSQKMVGKMLWAHCPSLVQQYQSCWRRSHDSLRRFSLDMIFLDTVLAFLIWLANFTNRALSIVSAHYVALTEPLRFGLSLHIPERVLSPLLKGINASREPRCQLVMALFLHHVLQHLTFNGVPLEENHLHQGTVFLLALVTGYRASQLTRGLHGPNPDAFTYLPSQERAGRRIDWPHQDSILPGGQKATPIVFASNTWEGSPRIYNSKSWKPLPPKSVACLLCYIIKDKHLG